MYYVLVRDVDRLRFSFYKLSIKYIKNLNLSIRNAFL